jgi:hypothetical protein
MTKLLVDLRGVILLFLVLVLILTMMNLNVKHLESLDNSTNISTIYEK